MRKNRGLYIVKCSRCKYRWSARAANPKCCPGCGSIYWNIPRQKGKDYSKYLKSSKFELIKGEDVSG